MHDMMLVLASGSADVGVLGDLLKLFALALVVTFACDRFRVPTIVGFLLTGVLAGPGALGLVSDSATVETMAEVGIILLLFTVGIEFSLKTLLKIKLPFFGGGTAQFILTSLAIVGIASVLGFSLNQAIFISFLGSLSCTSIGLKMLQQRAESDAPHGRLAVGILLFQDFLVVALVLLVPLLAGHQHAADPEHRVSILELLGRIVGLLVVVVVSARYLVPWMFFRIAAIRDREVFLMSVLVVGLAVAALTASVGLSLALGAFLAGLIISESEYSHRALGSILPFRDVFISLFFISIGMLLDPHVVLASPVKVLLVTAALVLLKILCAAAAVAILQYPLRVALLASFALSGIGEFSFVLAKSGLESGLISEDFFQMFLATSVLSLLVSPFIITAGPAITAALGLTRHDVTTFGKRESEALAECGLTDHLIIVGFGPVGRYSARAAAAAGIPYLIIEMNPQTVRIERANGEPIYYGDASQDVVLESAGIERARVLLVVIADPAGSRQIVQAARIISPTIKIVARTRFQSEIQPLRDLGADEVIPEELETAIELLSRVLKTYHVPLEQVDMTARQVRADGYRLLTEKGLETQRIHGIQNYLADVDIAIIRVKDRPAMSGQSLAKMELRTRHGVTVVAIRRSGETILNPDPLEPLDANDELIVVGQPEHLSTMTRKVTAADLIPTVTERG